MNVLDSYFNDGKTIEEISNEIGVTGDEVRDALRSAGLSVPVGASCDVATSKILARGFKSFRDYVQRIGLKPIKDQARELGVSRGTLTRTHDAFRSYLQSEQPSGGGDTRGDSGADSTT